MKQDEIEVGGTYELRWHDGSFTHVRVVGTTRYPVRRRGAVIGTKTRYRCLHLRTGRYVVVKSAAKLRCRVK